MGIRKAITLAEAGDVMTTALEGGIGYWSEAVDIVRDADLTCVSYALYNTEENSSVPLHVTRQKVRDAWRKIATSRDLCSDYLEQMEINTEEPGDAGGVDAGVADCIVQMAVFGEVIYG